jgi:hypothetical protein
LRKKIIVWIVRIAGHFDAQVCSRHWVILSKITNDFVRCVAGDIKYGPVPTCPILGEPLPIPVSRGNKEPALTKIAATQVQATSVPSLSRTRAIASSSGARQRGNGR